MSTLRVGRWIAAQAVVIHHSRRARCELASPGQSANVIGGSLNALAYE